MHADNIVAVPIVQALAALTGLRELSLSDLGRAVIPAVQQVASMTQLRSLQLEGRVMMPEEEDMLASLAQCTQLTSLTLHVGVLDDDHYRDHDLGPPAQLTRLRCLTVSQGVLLRDGGCWLGPLTELTRLCVTLPRTFSCNVWKCSTDEQRQHIEEEYVAGLQQQLQRVPVWPASMQQVVLDLPEDACVRECKPRCWSFTTVNHGSGQISVWLEQRRGSLPVAPGWARPLYACPHLPGVWELQGPASAPSPR
jgi:hypothetical protein